MAQDPFASIAKPINDDPFAAIAKPIGDTAPSPAAPTISQHPILDAASDFGKGLLKSGVSTISAADDFAAKHLPAFMTTPIGQAPTPENSAKAVAYAKQLATPTNTAQSIGKGIGNAAQFFIPGAGEEKLAGAGTELLSRVPKLASAAPTIAKMGASALGSGIVNSAQGGSFLGGAAAGAGGAGLGMGLKYLAPKIAETALRVRAPDRAFGANPGKAIIEETSGVKPSKIVETARDRMNSLNDEATNLALNSPASVSLAPTRLGVQDSATLAAARNNKGAIKDIGELGDQIGKEYGTSTPIPSDVPALRAVQLKRGLGDLANFSPTVRSDFADAAVGNAYHTLGNSINSVVPEIKPLNQRMQSLMPVIKRGTSTDLNAGILQRLSGRMTAHTGALLGGAAGYHVAGIPGAIGGLVLPELAGSPEVQMGIARAANSPLTRKLAIPAATGLGLQLGKNQE